MNRSIKLLGLVTLLLASVALVIIAINLRTKQPIIVPTSQEVAVATQPNDSPLPTPPLPDPPKEKPLACQFANVSSISNTISHPLGPYQFSEPRKLIESQGWIGIADWSPDGENILFIREDVKTPLQTIESLNIHSGQIIVYGERASSGDKPIWITAKDQVIGVAYTKAENEQMSLWFVDSATLSQTKQIDGLQNQFIAFRQNEQQILYLADSRLVQLTELTKPITSEINLAQWEYLDNSESNFLNVYRIGIRPNTPDVLLYNQKYSFIVNSSTNQICDIDFEESGEEERNWAVVNEWSPNSRFLSSLLTSGNPPVTHVDLSVLDTASNTSQKFAGERLESGRRYVNEVTWSPNSDVMATLVTIAEKDSFDYVGIYLVDAISLQSQRVLPKVEFVVGNTGWNMSWSPTGKHLVIVCNTQDSNGLCISDVSNS